MYALHPQKQVSLIDVQKIPKITVSGEDTSSLSGSLKCIHILVLNLLRTPCRLLDLPQGGAVSNHEFTDEPFAAARCSCPRHENAETVMF